MAPNGWQRKTTNVLLLDFFKLAASSTKIARISRFSCFVPYSMSQDQFWHVHSLARISVSWDMSDMLQTCAKIRSAIPAILASPVVLPAAAGVLVVALLSLRRGRQPWLEVDHACLHSFFVLEDRTFEWQCFRVQSEHNQHLIRTAKLVNDTFSSYFQELPLRYDGAWIAAYWQRRPLRLLQRCLVGQAVCRFFFSLEAWSLGTTSACVWSICFGSPRLCGSLHPSWFF